MDETHNYHINIIYFNCIIATAIIAMVYYNYQVSHPHSSSSTTDYYTTTTTIIIITTTTILSIDHTCHLNCT